MPQCEAIAAAQTYRPERRCAKTQNIEPVKFSNVRRSLCPHHKAQVERRGNVRTIR